MDQLLLFAVETFDFNSLWFQLPLLLIGVYVFSSLMSLKFGFSIFKRENYVERGDVPWGMEAAFIALLFFTFVGPFLGYFIVNGALKDHMPTFGDEIAVVSTEEAQPTDTAESELEDGELQETTEELSDAASVEVGAEGAAETQPAEESTEPEDAEAKDDADQRDLSKQHPLARMLIRAKDTPYFGLVFFVFILSVVIVAPLVEELVFRVIIQGACERWAKGLLLNPDADSDHRSKPGWAVCLLTIVPPALVFALLHASSPEDPEKPLLVSQLFRTTISSLTANILTGAFCVALLVKVFQAKSTDFGLASASNNESSAALYVKEFYRGMVLFLVIMPIVYSVKAVFQQALPESVVDPAPIFLFALWEGLVYYRTRSYPTVVGMHVGLNFTSFLFLCMAIA